MARTKKAEPVEEMVKVLPPEESKIAPLALDFGREDLNTLVAKVNEIIASM